MQGVINPDDCIWADTRAGVAATLPCTVCGDDGPHAEVLRIPSGAPTRATLVFYRCAACESGLYDPPGVTDFKDFDGSREDFWRPYVEVGGGVWETIWPILVAGPAEGDSLLDVGCGFGFAVDFWRRIRRSEAAGVELADYGAMGARLLDIPVHRELVQDCAALAGRRFDVVYASEVIEHVPDPTAFVALLEPFVAASGVLVMTTPSAEFVAQGNASPTLVAALSPGFHGFLLSSKAFARAARDAGFAEVEVRVLGEREFLWASRVPLRLDLSMARMREPYLDYLETWYRHGDHASPVWHGYVYRLARDLAHAGRYAEAQVRVDALMDALVASYGREIHDPVAMAARFAHVPSLEAFGRLAPYFLPCLYFTLAGIAQHHKRDGVAARRLYQGAADLGVECARRFGATRFLEAGSLVWPARAAAAELDLAMGNVAAATSMLARLATFGGDGGRTDGYARASRDLIESIVPRACERLAAASAWPAAEEVFAAYRGYLHRDYPDCDVTAQKVLDAVLAGDFPTEVPRDPAFAYFFAALLAARTEGSDAAAECDARLSAFAAHHRTHATESARLAALADTVRRYLPKRTRTLFEFSVKIPASITRNS